MSRVSHQTVRLSVGNHASAAAGMCVLELASVLAGEEFSAYPRSVCPVIAAFMRCYNDLVDDRRRQDLIPRAAAAVGTRTGRRHAGRRARACRDWVAEIAHPGFWSHPFWTLLSLRRGRRNEAAATYAALVAVDGEPHGIRHRAALDLLDWMLAIGRRQDGAPLSVPDKRPAAELEASR